MAILDFNKPKKVMSTEAWKSISADGAPPGVYTSNMSTTDMEKWKAKHIKGSDPRIEIRKTMSSQVLIVVRNITGEEFGHEAVKITTNGPIYMSFEQAEELQQAIQEAKEILLQSNK
jgi:hypothetical protein